MNILVSACVIGQNCKYNGGNNLNRSVVEFIQRHTVIEICPELLTGMKCPRACAEIVNGIVMSENGENVDAEYRKGVELAMEKIKGQKIDLAILQSRSPTCGVNTIYDGSFSGTLIEGHGLFTEAIIEKGIRVVDSENF
ncbi:DUF523 domain-containing protein [Clostridium sp. CM027]|uniref:DUF523 domain-containing protein n=1 Tax=Clostridium sp. CM027 TaxID=2849865 RepID=UPI001C6E831D|nr:DUF523 domain-containing protein [Clostridium sp. CM027]MBW9145836.1 DUF523 domain-containing protein [Clostridium sp. CM027]UVE42102.1 DUF523 domain-containing protein [Clostridium sp. CM027]